MTFNTQQIVVMGVSGCGKSHIGRLLAAALGLRFVDADDLHPAKNVAKMAAGEPLTDADRLPWLDRVAQELALGGVAVACSALKCDYRDRLQIGLVEFVFLSGSRAVLQARIAGRQDHFMPLALLDSQLATLEPPSASEAVIVDIDQTPAAIVAAITAGLARAE